MAIFAFHSNKLWLTLLSMNDFWNQLTTIFNNREIAIGIWLLGALWVCLFIENVRNGLFDVIKALLQPKLLVFFGIVALTVAVLSFLLSQIGLWTADQFPATILWFALSGCVMAGQSLDAKEDERHFKGLFRNSIRLTGLFEFIVVAHTFSIWVELVFFPALVFFGLLIAVADRDPEHQKVKAILEWVVAGIVVAFLWNSVTQIWNDPSLFFTTTTGLNFVLPVFFTIGCIPTFYLLYCYSHIEGARIQIDQKNFQPDDLKRYARKRFFLTFMLRPWLLRRATRQFHILPARTNADVDQIIHDILKFERASEAPPEIDPLEGWSPFHARDYLTDHGLRTNDYHEGFDEFWASAGYVDLDAHIFPNTATFYIEGEEGIVKTLKLTGKFRDEFESSLAMRKLREVAKSLCIEALGVADANFDELLPNKDVFETEQKIGGTLARAWGKRYPSEQGYEVFFTLSR